MNHIDKANNLENSLFASNHFRLRAFFVTALINIFRYTNIISHLISLNDAQCVYNRQTMPLYKDATIRDAVRRL